MVHNGQNMKPFGIKAIKAGNLGKYAADYLTTIDSLNTNIRNLDGLITAVNAKKLEQLDDLLRASAVLSDLTTLTLTGGKEASVLIPKKGVRKVTIPVIYLKKHNIEPNDPTINVGIFQPTDESHMKFFKDALPLFKRGWLIFRPARVLMVKTHSKHWQTFEVEPDSQDDNWIVSGEAQAHGEIPLRVTTETEIPFDLVLPYLRGIPYGEFCKILEDCNDTLLNLRKGLRDAISNVAVLNQKTITELRRDLINTQLEALERNFKKAIASHKYTIAGATVGVVCLSLSAILTGGATASISGLLGSGGLGYIAKEYNEFRRKLEEMKDNPFYLFWRAKYRP